MYRIIKQNNSKITVSEDDKSSWETFVRDEVYIYLIIEESCPNYYKGLLYNVKAVDTNLSDESKQCHMKN
jgi:hypothetical protein